MMMKQWKIGLLVLLLLLASCRKQGKEVAANTWVSGEMTVAVEETLLPIAREEVEVFGAVTPMAGVSLRVGNEVETMNAFLKDSVQVAIVGRPLSEEETASFRGRKLFPRSVRVATDALALVVNQANPDTLITVRQLQAVLSGKVADWKELFPASELGRLQLVFDNPHSGTVHYVIDSLNGGRPLSASVIKACRNHAEVFDYVAHTPGAMGVVGVNWLDAPDDVGRNNRDGIRVVSVSGSSEASLGNSFQPCQASIATGDYPLVHSVCPMDHFYYARLLAASQRLDEAAEHYCRTLALDSTRVECWKELADVCEQAKDYAGAIEAYDRFMDLAGTKAEVADFFRLGRLCYFRASMLSDDAGRQTDTVSRGALLARADSLFAIVALRVPDSYLGNFWHARINSLLDPETVDGLAKPYYEAALALLDEKPEVAPALLVECDSYLGYYYFLKGDCEKSREYWNRILTLDPKNEIAHKALDGLPCN